MTDRDYEKESADHDACQEKAEAKIKDHETRADQGTPQQRSDKRQLMNEMRGNKAAVDFNRAMFDYDKEHKSEEPTHSEPKRD